MPQNFRDICAELGCIVNTPGWPDEFAKAIRRFFGIDALPKIRTLSLFSGAGGLDIGFSDAGFEIVESVEIEKAFCKTLETNSGEGRYFEKSKVNCIDIREFDSTHLGRIDFIIGGPPCQTFSAAGRRANGVLGTSDARGVLFREYVRLLEELSPVGFLFENVYGIVGAEHGRPWAEIKDSFGAAGYKLYHRILDAADYGAPQHRERLIIVGLKDGKFMFPRPTHGPDSPDNLPFYNAGTAIQGLSLTNEERRPGLGGRFGKLLDGIPPGLNYSFYTREMGNPKPMFAWRSKFSDFLYKADPERPVRTIKASGGAYTGPLHWENRFFACAEYKRLQTFPDSYQISGTKQVAVKQIGNSVPPQLARILALSIQLQVFNSKLPFELPRLADSEKLTFRERKRELTRYYREKAQAAINRLANASVDMAGERTYSCNLSDDLHFSVCEFGVAEFDVHATWGDGLHLCIADETAKANPYGTIKVIPSERGWDLPVNSVIVDMFSSKAKAFTVAWKAFEYELSSKSLKADLVQLNGYYQYAPTLNCSCELNGRSKIADKKIITQIVSGKNVAKIIPVETLAKSWKIPECEVVSVAERLKTLGYEIRNSNTNPQIPLNCWLIPYAFPTMTWQSVQLRKKVR